MNRPRRVHPADRWPWVRACVRVLAALHVPPMALTIVGAVGYVGVGLMLARGGSWEAVAVGFFFVLLDVLDGSLARHLNRETPFGGFLDSLMDRYAEAAIYAGVAWRYFAETRPWAGLLAMAAWVSSFQVSYARARAECEIENCEVGAYARMGRFVTLAVLGALDRWDLAMGVIVLLSHVTIFQRIRHTARMLKKEREGI